MRVSRSRAFDGRTISPLQAGAAPSGTISQRASQVNAGLRPRGSEDEGALIVGVADDPEDVVGRRVEEAIPGSATRPAGEGWNGRRIAARWSEGGPHPRIRIDEHERLAAVPNDIAIPERIIASTGAGATWKIPGHSSVHSRREHGVLAEVVVARSGALPVGGRGPAKDDGAVALGIERHCHVRGVDERLIVGVHLYDPRAVRLPRVVRE